MQPGSGVTPALTQENWGILGHDQAVYALRRAIERDNVAHAYLFTGAVGSGRRTLALRFAQALNCAPVDGVRPTGRPCRQCRSCRKIERGVHPDVRVFDLGTQEEEAARDRAGSKNTALSIETVRAIQTGIALRPFESRWAVTIVGDAESMRGDAASAFLKTLEEPPVFAVVILVARGVTMVLPTIRSRCQVVELYPVERDRIERALIATYNVSRGDAFQLAALARGRPGWAINAAAEPNVLEARCEEVAGRVRLLLGGPLDLLEWAERLAERFRAGHRDEVHLELDAWIDLWRDLLLARAGCGDLAVTLDEHRVREYAIPEVDLERVHRALSRTREASQLLEQHVSPRLALAAMVRCWIDVVRPGPRDRVSGVREGVRSYG